MKDHIQRVLKQLEVDNDVKVLYACEAGSRAWGFPSIDSDYDVRFIYVHRTDWYLSIDKQRDTIEVPKQDAISIPINEKLDVSGWELTKALRLFRKSNPSLFEWLHSSIKYYQAYSTIEKMQRIAGDIFSPVIGVNHYVKMGKGNFRDCLQGNELKIKKYLNVLRPILAAKWIEKRQTFSPVDFHVLLDKLIPIGELKDEFFAIIDSKMNGEVCGKGMNLEIIHSFIRNEIEFLETFAKTKILRNGYNPTNDLNQIFRDTLLEVWG